MPYPAAHLAHPVTADSSHHGRPSPHAAGTSRSELQRIMDGNPVRHLPVITGHLFFGLCYHVRKARVEGAQQPIGRLLRVFVLEERRC